MTERINTYNDFKSKEGCIIGSSPYFCITEEKLDLYSKSISVEQDGENNYEKNELIDFFIISITPYLWKQIVDINNVKMVINYGFDRIALINKVMIGEHIRLVASVESVKQIHGITKVVVGFTLEIKERNLKAMDGKAIFLYHFKE